MLQLKVDAGVARLKRVPPVVGQLRPHRKVAVGVKRAKRKLLDAVQRKPAPVDPVV